MQIRDFIVSFSKHSGKDSWLIAKYPLSLIAFLFLILLFLYNINLLGPFVFGDEAEYSLMINSLLIHGNLAGFKQYGPLYPFIAAVGIYLFSPNNVYNFVRSLNVIFAFATLIPFWLFAKLLLKDSKLIWLALLSFILAPFWTFTIVTWTNPLFYFLIYSSIYLTYSVIKNNGSGIKFFVLGLICGLLFLAKPIGLFYWVSLLLCLVVIYNKRVFSEKAVRYNLFLLFLGGAILIFPWIYRNIFIASTSALGYAPAHTYLLQFLFHTPIFKVIVMFIKAFCFQVSYVIMASLGCAFLVFYFNVKEWRRILLSDKLIFLYLIFTLTFICLISALYMMSFPLLGYWVTNGRYLTQFTPIFILLLLYYCQKYSFGINLKILPSFIISIGALLIVFFATPLFNLGAFMIPNSPDLALYFLVFHGKHIPWEQIFDPTFFQRLLPIAVILISIAPIVFFRRSSKATRIAVVLGIIYFILSSLHQASLIREMANTQRPMNRLFYNAFSYPSSFKICSSNTYFNKRLQNDNLRFIHNYWCPSSRLQYASLGEICKLTHGKIYTHDNAKYFLISSNKGHQTYLGKPINHDGSARLAVFSIATSVCSTYVKRDIHKTKYK